VAPAGSDFLGNQDSLIQPAAPGYGQEVILRAGGHRPRGPRYVWAAGGARANRPIAISRDNLPFQPDLSLEHLEDLRAQLQVERKLNIKTIKNIIDGSLRALVRDARKAGITCSISLSESCLVAPDGSWSGSLHRGRA
jgi:hypothetical protein